MKSEREGADSGRANEGRGPGDVTSNFLHFPPQLALRIPPEGLSLRHIEKQGLQALRAKSLCAERYEYTLRGVGDAEDWRRDSRDRTFFMQGSERVLRQHEREGISVDMRGRDCKGASGTERAPEQALEKIASALERTRRGVKVEAGETGSETRAHACGPVHIGAAGTRGIMSVSILLGTNDTESAGQNEVRPIKPVPPSGRLRTHDSHHRGAVHSVVLIVVVIFATAAIRPLSSLGATICCDGLRGHDDRAVRLQVGRGISIEDSRHFRHT